VIAIESIKKFRGMDYIAIVLFALAWAGLILLINKFLSFGLAFAVSLLTTAFLLAFCVLLVRKAFAVTLFYIIGAVILFLVGPKGLAYGEILAMGLAGLIFELGFMALKFEIKGVGVDVVIGTAISIASVPFLTAVFLSWDVAKDMLFALLNQVLAGFLIGIAGALLALLVWTELRTTKIVLKFEYWP